MATRQVALVVALVLAAALVEVRPASGDETDHVSIQFREVIQRLERLEKGATPRRAGTGNQAGSWYIPQVQGPQGEKGDPGIPGADISVGPVLERLIQLEKKVTMLAEGIYFASLSPLSLLTETTEFWKLKLIFFFPAFTSVANGNRLAVVRYPLMKPATEANRSMHFTCESGLPLSSCFWARTVHGQRRVVLLEQFVQHDPVDGVDYISDKLKEGKCGVSIPFPSEDHYGLWSCTLITTNRLALTGKVHVSEGKCFYN